MFMLFLQDSDEPSLLEYIKSQVCDNVALYAQKYDEEFHVSWGSLLSLLIDIKRSFWGTDDIFDHFRGSRTSLAYGIFRHQNIKF